MFPPRTPLHVQSAHASIAHIYEFLARYERWIADGGPSLCDFALGNPQTLPLNGFVTALRDAAIPKDPSWYAYKTNETTSRRTVQDSLRRLTGVEWPVENIFMTNGATGALLVVMNALIAPGDEVIINNPPWFFYEGMVLNSGGKPIAVDTDRRTFDLDLAAIERAISDRTRFVIVNSPNNPSGRIYAENNLRGLGDVLVRASRQLGRPIYLVSDEVYRAIVFDGATFHSPTRFYKNSIMIYSYGKTLLTPGQRIGYLALSPHMDDVEGLRTIMHSTQILSGWAMASALMQHGLPQIERLSLDINVLQRRRDRLVEGLRGCGYEVAMPEGAFYITPRTPTADDRAYADLLASKGVLCLPGSVVKMPGYLRASLTANDEMIDRALPIFAAARKEFAERTE